ncbi:MAG: TlpA family protein disulfide reductase [bacterium]|nr:TlpA family protein disulfide reductase [Candidatus Limimorpha equi]
MKGWTKSKAIVFSALALIVLCCLLPKSSYSQKRDIPQVDAFFQNYDFNDTALIHSEVFSQKLAEYVYQFHENEDSVNQETDYIVGLSPLFEKAKCNMLTYGFILDFMLNGFENLGLASVTDYLLNFPALNENEISAEQGERLERIAEPYQKVKEGTLAPDIEGINSEGQFYHLHDSQAKYVLVVFWATGCEHCHDFLKQVRKKLYINKEYELVTFAIAEDETDWRESLEEMRLSGQHFFDEQRWGGKAFEDYHVTQAPTAFLIDENKIIVAKVYDWKELKEKIRNLK